MEAADNTNDFLMVISAVYLLLLNIYGLIYGLILKTKFYCT